MIARRDLGSPTISAITPPPARRYISAIWFRSTPSLSPDINNTGDFIFLIFAAPRSYVFLSKAIILSVNAFQCVLSGESLSYSVLIGVASKNFASMDWKISLEAAVQPSYRNADETIINLLTSFG